MVKLRFSSRVVQIGCCEFLSFHSFEGVNLHQVKVNLLAEVQTLCSCRSKSFRGNLWIIIDEESKGRPRRRGRSLQRTREDNRSGQHNTNKIPKVGEWPVPRTTTNGSSRNVTHEATTMTRIRIHHVGFVKESERLITPGM
jgi:hypothetical protein